MAASGAPLQKLRKICLSLPDTVESEKWGKPHFCVADKIFAGCDDVTDRLIVGFKLEMSHAKRMVKLPGVKRAPYVGHKGWVSVDTTVLTDWKMLEELILESYKVLVYRAKAGTC